MNTMYSVVVHRVEYMAEKRQGQDLVRLYLPVDLKERFKLYCQLKGATMTEVIREQIEELLTNAEMTDLLKERLRGNDRDPPTDRTQPPPPTPGNGEASQAEPPKQGQRQPTKRGKGKEG